MLCVDDVYGGTQRYLRKILGERQGVEISLVDLKTEECLKKSIKKNTKLIWLETPTNPTLKLFDIKMICKVARQKNIITVVDNTFFTPYLQNPLDMGADIVVHSITKYIGGHSDVLLGCICMNDRKIFDQLLYILNSIGSGAPPFGSYFALRGSKTLAIRRERA